MKKVVSNAVTVLLVLSAAIVAGMVVRREFARAAAPAPAGPPEEREVPGWEKLTQGSVLGDSTAALRIVEFSDFTCGYCDRVRPELTRIRALDPERIAIVYRHYVREDARPAAFAAAMAAECAGEQERFGEYHDALFNGQSSIGEANWMAFARTAGVPDLAAFRRCVDEERFRGRVERDLRAAEELGVPGTPTFIFAGRMIIGVNAPARLQVLVGAALGR